GGEPQPAPLPQAPTPAPAATPVPAAPSAAAVMPPAPTAQRKAEPQPAGRGKGPAASVKRAAPPPEPAPKPASRSLSLSELAQMYPDTFKRYGPTNKRQVALTFDDAPDAKYTPQVLDVLKAHKVKATFFLVGHRATLHPELVKRMVREGHAIGNHSYNHPNFAKLSLESFTQQIEQTQNILKPLIGYSPRLIRPPYGEIKQEQLEWAAARHMMVVNWNVDSNDWKQLDADHVSANILTHAGPGAIVLQHSGGGVGQDLSGTVKALPGIIQKLRSYGLNLVTVPELLGIPKEN
ncbi:polysaccharide deacetylase family protein, partial [Paenibacillus contaminans]